jgi:hypothetical protein
MEQDGWTLRSGVKLSKKYPKTFHMPTEKQRTELKPKDIAKLSFDIEDRYDGNTYGERMWLEVTGKAGPYYVGALRNPPLTPHRYLKWGCSVVFPPQHVIDLVPARRTVTRRKSRVL